jgi:hypothetical protein
MANKISLLKKLRIFRDFKKVLKLNKVELQEVFGARIDNAYRIYNVINIPVEEIGEPYNLRKSDIDLIAEKSVRDYSSSISKYLDSKGLQEMYDFYEIKKVDKYSYLIVIGFSLPNDPFRSNIYYNRLYYRVVPVVSIVSLILLLISFFN